MRAILLVTAAVLCAAGATAFALIQRLPLPFDGFAIWAAAGLAFLGTLTASSWMPARWLWSDTELLTFDFCARHGIAKDTAQASLLAISGAHNRADALRRAAKVMREDAAKKINDLADRLDGAAREIFYSPDRLRSLRAILVRSELIEEAATAHAKLRRRDDGAMADHSRARLLASVEALENALDHSDLMVAQGLLQKVDVASDVAERVLGRMKKET
jgi:hypothetical protein